MFSNDCSAFKILILKVTLVLKITLKSFAVELLLFELIIIL